MKIKTDAISSAPLCKDLIFSDDTRVFVVGDLDASYSKLEDELNKVGFNAQQDQLISLGDVIDRGRDSVKLIKYLQDIGAHMVLGNHEHMMLEALLSRDSYAMRMWMQNGGKWHQSEPIQTLIEMCKWLKQQPLALKLAYKGKTIGISHTLPPTWSWEHFPGDSAACSTSLLWDRERFTKRNHNINHGVDFSLHGHNSTPEPVWIGNSYHIDTGRFGSPTVVDLAQLTQTYHTHIS